MRISKAIFTGVVRPPYVRARTALSYALFDRRYGIDTEGEASPADLGLPDGDSSGYQPARLLSLRRILPPREVHKHDVFVDFGSGKGRAVLQAALHYPFRAAYGVEISESLHEIAERNLHIIRPRLRCRNVSLVRSDALDFDIPSDVTVVLFNNPFRGEVFSAVLDRLLQSVDRNPRTLRIVYGNPVEEAALLHTGRVKRMRRLRGWRPGDEWSRSNSYRLYTLS